MTVYPIPVLLSNGQRRTLQVAAPSREAAEAKVQGMVIGDRRPVTVVEVVR